MAPDPGKQLRRPEPDQINANVSIEQERHGKAFFRFWGLGCWRSAMKSGGNLLRLLINESQERAAGSRSTPFPDFLMNTRSPSKRNSRGSRTAWLRPFRKSFAVFICVGLQFSGTGSICPARIRRLRRSDPQLDQQVPHFDYAVGGVAFAFE